MKRDRSQATVELRPQPGPQEKFLSSKADIAVLGGAAGGGKSYSLLLEVLYNHKNPKFRAAIFRRTIPQVRQPGGLWDTSEQIYGALGAVSYQNTLTWRFESGATVQFSGLESEADRFNWLGSQLAFLGWDELTGFSESQFWFLLSRVRSMSGVKGYVRCTCNPDPDSWVRNFLSWWIDDATGFAIPERSGVIRWFVRDGDEIVWSDTREELELQFGPESHPKSVTFIPSKVTDNKILLESDPAYLANLRALPLVDRARLLDGNWNVRSAAGLFFKREWFEIIDRVPEDVASRCRYWDRAATPKTSSNDPDWSVGVLLAKNKAGIYFIEDVLRLRASPWQVESSMRQCAQKDPRGTIVAYAQDPGSAGVCEAQATARALDGFKVKFSPVTGDKETRAKPISSQAEAGNVKIVRGLWNNDFLRVLESFPEGSHDDDVDALSGAHQTLRSINKVRMAIFNPGTSEFDS